MHLFPSLCGSVLTQGRVSLRVARTKALLGIKKPSSHNPVKDVEELSSYALWEHTVGRQNGATTLENSLAIKKKKIKDLLL